MPAVSGVARTRALEYATRTMTLIYLAGSA
jgi:hypothetical protein